MNQSSSTLSTFDDNDKQLYRHGIPQAQVVASSVSFDNRMNKKESGSTLQASPQRKDGSNNDDNMLPLQIGTAKSKRKSKHRSRSTHHQQYQHQDLNSVDGATLFKQEGGEEIAGRNDTSSIKNSWLLSRLADNRIPRSPSQSVPTVPLPIFNSMSLNNTSSSLSNEIIERHDRGEVNNNYEIIERYVNNSDQHQHQHTQNHRQEHDSLIFGNELDNTRQNTVAMLLNIMEPPVINRSTASVSSLPSGGPPTTESSLPQSNVEWRDMSCHDSGSGVYGLEDSLFLDKDARKISNANDLSEIRHPDNRKADENPKAKILKIAASKSSSRIRKTSTAPTVWSNISNLHKILGKSTGTELLKVIRLGDGMYSRQRYRDAVLAYKNAADIVMCHLQMIWSEFLVSMIMKKKVQRHIASNSRKAKVESLKQQIIDNGFTEDVEEEDEGDEDDMMEELILSRRERFFMELMRIRCFEEEQWDNSSRNSNNHASSPNGHDITTTPLRSKGALLTTEKEEITVQNELDTKTVTQLLHALANIFINIGNSHFRISQYVLSLRDYDDARICINRMPLTGNDNNRSNHNDEGPKRNTPKRRRKRTITGSGGNMKKSAPVDSCNANRSCTGTRLVTPSPTTDEKNLIYISSPSTINAATSPSSPRVPNNLDFSTPESTPTPSRRRVQRLQRQDSSKNSIGSMTIATTTMPEGEYQLLDAITMNNIASVYAVSMEYSKAARIYSNCLKFKRRALRALIERHNKSIKAVNSSDSSDINYSNEAKEKKGGGFDQRNCDASLGTDNVKNLLIITTSKDDNDGSSTITNLQQHYQQQYEHNQSVLAISSTLHNIGLVRSMLKSYSKAKESYLNALSQRVDTCGLDDPIVASTMNNLGDLYYAEGDYGLALRSYNEVLRIYTDKSARSKNGVGGNFSDCVDMESTDNFNNDHIIKIASSLHNIGLTYYKCSPYIKAKQVLADALQIRMNVLGPFHLDVSATLHLLGLVLTAIGDLNKSADCFASALKIRLEKLDENHLSVLNSFLGLGIVHQKQGDLDDALSILNSVHDARMKRLGKHHLSTLEALQQIGLVYKDKGHYERAIQVFQHVLSAREDQLGSEAVEVAETMGYLSSCRARLGGSIDKALNICMNSLQILEEKIGKDHISYGATLKVLGDLRQDLEDLDGAVECYDKVLRINALWQGPDHLDSGDVFNDIGNVRFKKGEYLLAKNAYTESYRIKCLWLDSKNASVWTTLNNLGHSHYKNGDLSLAFGAYTKSLDCQINKICNGKEAENNIALSLRIISEKLQGIDEESEAKKQISIDLGQIAGTLRHIGLVRQEEGKIDKSLEAYELALLARKIQPFRDHVAYSLTAETVGMLYFNKGSYEKAMAAFLDSLKVKEMYQGNDTVDVARTLNNIANVHFSQGNLTEAMEIYERALEVKRSILGNDHDEVSNTLNNIAHVMFKSGREEESLKAYNEVLSMRRQKYGDDHLILANTLSNLGDVHLKKGNFQEAKASFKHGVMIRKLHLGSHHSENIRALESLAHVHVKLCEWKNAEFLYKELLSLKRDKKTEDFAKTLELLARSMIEQGKDAYAIPHLQEALHIRQMNPGSQYDVLELMKLLAFVCRKAGKSELAIEVCAEIERIQDSFITFNSNGGSVAFSC